MQQTRIRNLSYKKEQKGIVAYWMSRDQRVEDNWALIYAQRLAQEQQTSIVVIFSLAPSFLDATLRQYDFMLKGLQEVEESLKKLHIPFYIYLGSPTETIFTAIKELHIRTLVTDFSPLRISREWKQQIASKIQIPLYEVDAHNIIPVWEVSEKQEYAAYTIRPKIHKLLPEYVTEIPTLKKQTETISKNKIDWKNVYDSLQVNTDVKPVTWIIPGENAAQKRLKKFIAEKLSDYDSLRNDPSKQFQSDLSPYLHFGQLSAQRIALEISKAHAPQKDKEAFLEELIVRRELAENFCYYNPQYDSAEGFPQWAKKSLSKHEKDKREFTYSKEEFEQGKTHDELWNTAQMEMINKGKMHGYMRMYWAKKILEWTKNPKEAMEIAIYLNDKYELDGRDPNGYVGIAWSIGGVHDRAWFERPIFGLIRFMSGNSLAKKFDTKTYISSVTSSLF